MTNVNPAAKSLNDQLEKNAPALASMLSQYARKLYFPKGIITQTQEAKEHGCRYNATVGIALEKGVPMHLPCLGKQFNQEISPEELYPYAPALGIKALRDLWKKKIGRQNPSLPKEAFSTPIVTQAISHGLALAADLFMNEGDVVILPDKFWGNYRLSWELKMGVHFDIYPFFDSALHHLNLEAFSEKLEVHKGKKQIIILNFPNNPTGYTPSQEEATKLLDQIRKYAELGSRMVVLCDDAYYGLTYERSCLQESFFASLSQVHENVLAIKMDGSTKEAFTWGFRIGFLSFGSKNASQETYAILDQKVAGAIRATISSASLPMQTIVQRAFSDPDFASEQKGKYALLKERYQEAKKMAELPRYSSNWQVYPFNSGYFMCLRLRGVNAEDLRLHLIKTESLGTISSGETDLRIAFSCVEKEDIQTVYEKVARGVEFLQKNRAEVGK